MWLGILFVAWVVVVPSLVLGWNLAGLRWRPLRRLRASFDEIPEPTHASLSGDGLELAALGFELVSPARVEDFQVGPARNLGYHLVHRVLNVHAFLRTAGGRPGTMLVLESYVGDPSRPTMWATMHRRFAAVSFASERARVDYRDEESAAELLQAHLAARDVDPRAPLALDDEHALEVSGTCWSAWLTSLAGQRYWRRVGDHFEPTLRAFVELPWRWRLDGTIGRARAQLPRFDRSVALDGWLAAYEPVVRRWSGVLPWRFVVVTVIWLLVLGSVPVLLVPGAGSYLGYFALAVVVHELGHLAALRLCGIAVRGPSAGGVVQRIPFGTSLAKEAFIVLSGPVPGVVLGASLMTWARVAGVHGELSARAFAGFGTAVLWVNVLSLLPVLPYDGGRLLHRVLLGSPRAFAAVASVLALASMFIFVSAAAPTMMALVGFLTIWTVWRDAGHERALRTLPDATASEWRLRVLDRLRHARPNVLWPSMARRLELRMAAGPSSLVGRVALAVVYASAVALGSWALATGGAAVTTEWPTEPDRWAACDAGRPTFDEGNVIFCRAERAVARELDSSLRSYAGLTDYCIGGPWDDPYALDPAVCAERSAVVRVSHGEATLDDEDEALVAALSRARSDAEAYEAMSVRLGSDCTTRSRIGYGPRSEAGMTSLILEDATQRQDAVRWMCGRGCVEVGTAAPRVSLY